MAVKIVRQAKKIVLIGAPTSAGAHAPGQERAPAALRAAGLVARLTEIGFEVTDAGDCPAQLHRPDDDSPRARNVGPVLAMLNALRPHVEQAVKSGALPLILGGDCTIALATIAAVRRYFPHLSLVYCDRDADLQTPATTPSGCLHGMVISHIIGRGSPELVRFWGEPPLVREPDIALFGLERMDPPEASFLERSPIRRYTSAEVSRLGPAVAADAALARIHTGGRQFVLHFDVDVIAAGDFSATDLPAEGGLRLDEIRQALEVFVRQSNLAAFEITEFNPDRDPDGAAARVLLDLLATALAGRIPSPAPEEAPQPSVSAPAIVEVSEQAVAAPPATEEIAADAAESRPAEVSKPDEPSAPDSGSPVPAGPDSSSIG